MNLMSSSPKAKFAPRSPRKPSPFTRAERLAFAFAKKVRRLAVGIVDAAIAEVVFEGKRDPKVYGLALLCRSISNFEGSLRMVRRDQAVESRTLVRSCFENLFLVAGLCEDGVDFVEAMRSDNAANRRSLGKLGPEALGSGAADSHLGEFLNAQIEGLLAEFPKPQKLRLNEMCKGLMERAYRDYRGLSHDAAHTSVDALKRHYRQGKKGRRIVEVVPPFKPGERLATLDMACDAVFGACIGVSQILGGTSQDEAVRALFEKFERQGRRAAPLDRASPA